MDLLRAMQVFVRVADTGSFTLAADQLHVDRSVVTRQISALEKHLQSQLIQRSTRQLSLTAAGERYLRQCREILDMVQFAGDSLHTTQETPRGPIRFGIPADFGMPYVMPLLADFVAQNPLVELELTVSDGAINLIESGLDMAIHITSRLDDTLVAKRLTISRRLLVASPEYLQQHGTPVHPRELRSHDCIGTQPGESWPFVVEGKLQSFSARGRLSCANPHARLQAAEYGLGIAYLPSYVLRQSLQQSRLTPLLSDYTQVEEDICLVCPGPRHIAQQVRTLAEFLAQRLDRPWWDEPIGH